jgi:hypothetical protein
LYLLPTREFVRDLASWLVRHAGRRRVLEVCAGDGFLTSALCRAAPHLRMTAIDSGLWERADARMTLAERRRHGGKVSGLKLGPHVSRRDAVAAVRALKPEVVLAAWLPPGKLFEHLVRSPCRLFVDIGVGGGVTSQGEWGWRFAHAFLPELERHARSRLDAGKARRSQVTLYFGGPGAAIGCGTSSPRQAAIHNNGRDDAHVNAAALPAAGFALGLPLEPGPERCEVVQDRAGVGVLLARKLR